MTRYIYGLFYGLPLSKIIFLMIFLVLAWSKFSCCFLQKPNKKRIWKLVNGMGAICMIAVILAVTVSTRSMGTLQVQWAPFASFQAAKIQPEIYRSMLMNVFLFFPLGLTMPYVLPEKWKHNALLTIIFACVFSIAIEYLQYYFQLGRAETDDVICNTLGCFIGTISDMLSREYEKCKNSA